MNMRPRLCASRCAHAVCGTCVTRPGADDGLEGRLEDGDHDGALRLRLGRDLVGLEGALGEGGEGGGERDGPRDKGHASRLRLRAHVHAHP